MTLLTILGSSLRTLSVVRYDEASRHDLLRIRKSCCTLGNKEIFLFASPLDARPSGF